MRFSFLFEVMFNCNMYACVLVCMSLCHSLCDLFSTKYIPLCQCTPSFCMMFHDDPSPGWMQGSGSLIIMVLYRRIVERVSTHLYMCRIST